jgi:hypothetical protein
MIIWDLIDLEELMMTNEEAEISIYAMVGGLFDFQYRKI